MSEMSEMILQASKKDFANFSENLGIVVEDKFKTLISEKIDDYQSNIFVEKSDEEDEDDEDDEDIDDEKKDKKPAEEKDVDGKDSKTDKEDDDKGKKKAPFDKD